MASKLNLEPIDASDITTTTTLLHEVIPLTGTIVSGTYGGNGVTLGNEPNIKNYVHGMFQSVYDYPYLSSSSNHIFDISMGYDSQAGISASVEVMGKKKMNMYNQFAQVLLGYTSSTDDNILKFERDLKLDQSAGSLMKENFFISFARLLTKDQIKRQTFSITLGTSSWADPFAQSITLSDVSASCATDAGVGQGLGGQYGLLYDTTASITQPALGLIWYQSGIAIVTASLFVNNSADFYKSGSNTWSVSGTFSSASITGAADALRHRTSNISYNNTTEINSQIYFCNVKHNKFNYSSNPTYTSASKIRVKNVATDTPIAYITTVGLYDSAGDCVAVAKLSEPLRKDSDTNLVLRVRLDY